MEQITEEMGIHNEWYKEASNITLEQLPEFLNKLLSEYRHDYGTICHALAAGAIATTWAMDKSKYGGITGFQAGAVMWEFVKNWNYSSNKCGLKMIDYDNFLYPQYEDKFQKTINKSTWKAIQKEAEKNIEEANNKHEKYLQDLDQYRIDIEKYIEKYPDYYERQDYYDRLCYGTSQQWDEYHKKEESGFEFAPSEPFESVFGNKVYQHWMDIVNGKVPFGYRVVED